MRILIAKADGYIGKAVYRSLSAGEEGEEEEKKEFIGSFSSAESSLKNVQSIGEVGTESYRQAVLSANVIVLDLYYNYEEAKGIVDLLATTKDIPDGGRTVVGISSVYTWWKTKKPKDAEGLKEEDFRKRRPSPKFSSLKSLETFVMNLQREGVRANVIAAGVLYGQGEAALHGVFKDAWLCETAALGIPATDGKGGANRLPMIHVSDLGSIAAKVALEDPEKEYIVAVDSAKNTLAEVVKAISEALGPKAVEPQPVEDVEARMVKDDGITMLQGNKVFDREGSYVEGVDIEWVAQEGLVESISAVVEEYIKSRDLRPMRLVVNGPPASGKSFVSEALAAEYYIPHVTAAVALEHILNKNTALAVKVKKVLKAKGRLSSGLMGKVVRKYLLEPHQRNRGFVLDGYPRNYNEAAHLFYEVEGEEEEEDAEVEEAEEGEGEEEEAVEDEEEVIGEDDEEGKTVHPKLAPTGVIMLTGPSEVFAARMKALPESQVKANHNDEGGFKRRTEKWTAANQPDDPRATIVFFEKRCNRDVVEAEVKDNEDLNALFAEWSPLLERGGRPYNYHPTEEELKAAEDKRKAEEEKQEEEKQAKEAQEKKAEEQERQQREEEESLRLQEIARQEEALLEARSEPLRAYLVKNVIPTLTKGLLEVSKVMPEDPIDYLAEYLFEHSPAEGEERSTMEQ